jgi:hypothetical protein
MTRKAIAYAIFAAAVCIAVALCVAVAQKNNKKRFDKWADPAIGRQGNDFASESMLPVGARWLAQRTRCVSCENDMVKRHGLSAGQYSNPTKCLTCQDKSFKYLDETIEALGSTNAPKAVPH